MMRSPLECSGRTAYFENLLDTLHGFFQNGYSHAALTGQAGSAKALILALLAQRTGGSMLIVSRSETEADSMYENLLFFHQFLGFPTSNLHRFPSWHLTPYQHAVPSIDWVSQRMRTLHQLCETRHGVVVTTVWCLLQRLLPQSVFLKHRLKITPGLTIERDTLIGRCLRLGYRPVSFVQDPGEVSVRGGIVDVYSTARSEPVRLEFLGDMIESIRSYDPDTQISQHRLDHVWLLPAREVIIEGELPDAPLPPGAEWDATTYYPSMNDLSEYCSTPLMVVLDEPAELAAKAEEIANTAGESWAGDGAPPERVFVPWEVMSRPSAQRKILALEAIPQSADHSSSNGRDGTGARIHVSTRSPASIGVGSHGTPFATAIAMLNTLRERTPVVIVARSSSQKDRLHTLFAEYGVPSTSWRASLWPPNPETHPSEPLYVTQGNVSHGFLLDGVFSLIPEEDLFAKKSHHRQQRASHKNSSMLSTVEGLSLGDLVVHIDHGIGRYAGLRRLTIQGYEQEFLMIEYAGGDFVYVPLDRVNQVQCFSCGEEHPPRLDSLRGTRWAQTKARVKKSIEEMADELIELYARREVATGFRYSVDSVLSHEFDAAFEYDETPDQLRAIEEVKRDMESSRPMDRLVCGDVGYGKTEVAMRAAFKAVLDNRQAVLLVPTTLLASQHYENFSQRFAPFPVLVGLLSRFQTPTEQRAVLKGTAAGSIDILIGTHRVLQKDVTFRNLGLVIIDEEQWFGVRHKERLKQLRAEVDVLTLTATPIPRTLHLSLSSIRDLSVIDTPPSGRLAIKTQVIRPNDHVVRDAIQAELDRGGQVFFVHNQVKTIEQIGMWLQGLIPQATIRIAHGQMDNRQLETVMVRFLRRKIDVLVCTAIIQSGLDIPSANTILINRADTFGLAQLYQLRGRVGRAGEQAYAYFLIPNEGVLSTDAKRRLEAIQEFCDFGSGFRIAARDLEIRGSGNLLGKQQSGHIEAVGFDLYIQMLEQAVRTRKGEVMDEPIDPQLKLPVSAFIPEEYVSDIQQRLALYKRLSSSVEISELAMLHGEIVDRFGPIPDALERLFEVMEVKLLAKALRCLRIEAAGRTMIFNLAEDSRGCEDGVPRLLNRYAGRIRFHSPYQFEIQHRPACPEQTTPRAVWEGIFHELKDCFNTLRGTLSHRATAPHA